MPAGPAPGPHPPARRRFDPARARRYVRLSIPFLRRASARREAAARSRRPDDSSIARCPRKLREDRERLRDRALAREEIAPKQDRCWLRAVAGSLAASSACGFGPEPQPRRVGLLRRRVCNRASLPRRFRARFAARASRCSFFASDVATFSRPSCSLQEASISRASGAATSGAPSATARSKTSSIRAVVAAEERGVA